MKQHAWNVYLAGLLIVTSFVVYETFRRVGDATVRDAIFWVLFWMSGSVFPIGAARRLTQAGMPAHLAMLPVFTGGLTLLMAMLVIWRIHAA